MVAALTACGGRGSTGGSRGCGDGGGSRGVGGGGRVMV